MESLVTLSYQKYKSHFSFISHRKQYKKDAETMYHSKMLAAHAGKSDYPKIRTFLPIEASTNCVYDDMKEAEKWSGMESKVDIRELTWEQRERVLRLLFAKLNGLKSERYALLYDLHVFIQEAWLKALRYKFLNF